MKRIVKKTVTTVEEFDENESLVRRETTEETTEETEDSASRNPWTFPTGIRTEPYKQPYSPYWQSPVTWTTGVTYNGTLLDSQRLVPERDKSEGLKIKTGTIRPDTVIPPIDADKITSDTGKSSGPHIQFVINSPKSETTEESLKKAVHRSFNEMR
jgi:hypothetical protein